MITERWGGGLVAANAPAALESRAYLPGKMRMDLSVVGACGAAGETLRADVTLAEAVADANAPVAAVASVRVWGEQRHLVAREAQKVAKYAGHYPPGQVMVGAAFDVFGGVGPGARMALACSAAVAEITSGRPQHVVRRELETAIGLVLVRQGALWHQRMAEANGVSGVWYPRVRASVAERRAARVARATEVRRSGRGQVDLSSVGR